MVGIDVVAKQRKIWSFQSYFLRNHQFYHNFQETRIQPMEKDSKKMHCFSVLNTAAGGAVSHIFAADSLADFQEWMRAFRQHFFDLSK